MWQNNIVVQEDQKDPPREFPPESLTDKDKVNILLEAGSFNEAITEKNKKKWKRALRAVLDALENIKHDI